MLILILCFLTGCRSEKNIEEVPLPQGIKPVIFYNSNLYWMSTDRPSDELPKDYIDSGDKIIGSEKDSNIVPTQECFTSAMNSNDVGAEIYINPNNHDAIVVSTGENYITFVLDK